MREDTAIGSLAVLQRERDRIPQSLQTGGFANACRNGLMLDDQLLRIGMAGNENHREAPMGHEFRGGQAIHHGHIEINDDQIHTI